MNMEEQLQAAVDSATTDSDLWHTIIHGDDETEVTTENGTVPSVSKQLKDVRTTITGGVIDVVTAAESARDEALQAKVDTLALKEETAELKDDTSTYCTNAENYYNQSVTVYNSISTATSSAISSITSECATQVGLAESAGTTQIGLLQTEGASQIALATAQAELAESYATNISVRVQSVYQTLQALTGTSVDLQDEAVIYSKTISSATILTFNTSNLTKTDQVITFELFITLSSVVTITFPTSVTWLNDETPDLSSANKYLFAFRSFDNGSTWIGNLQGSF